MDILAPSYVSSVNFKKGANPKQTYRLDNINCTKLPSNKPTWHITGRIIPFSEWWLSAFKMSDMFLNSSPVFQCVPVLFEEVCHHLLSPSGKGMTITLHYEEGKGSPRRPFLRTGFPFTLVMSERQNTNPKKLILYIKHLIRSFCDIYLVC